MSTDAGLTEAVQRVMRRLGEITTVDPDDPAWTALAEEVARAAREDVADRTRQARADALAETALDVRTGRWPDESLAAWLDLRAAAIREGREP